MQASIVEGVEMSEVLRFFVALFNDDIHGLFSWKTFHLDLKGGSDQTYEGGPAQERVLKMTEELPSLFSAAPWFFPLLIPNLND